MSKNSKRSSSLQSNGWIKLSRKILKWEHWSDIKIRNTFLTILLLASYNEEKAGAVKISQRNLSQLIGITRQELRRCLAILCKTGEIMIEKNQQKTNQTTHIIVAKYKEYQNTEPKFKPTLEPKYDGKKNKKEVKEIFLNTDLKNKKHGNSKTTITAEL